MRLFSKTIVNIILTVCLLSLVSACGFHLRGRVNLPDQLNYVYIVSDEHSIRAKLGDAITSSGGQVVDKMEQSTAVLTIYSVNKGRYVKAVSGQGRVREYTIKYAVEFEVKSPKGKILLPKQQVTKSRNFAFNEAEVVGKAVEESIILTELEREVVPTILTKLQHIIPEQSVMPGGNQVSPKQTGLNQAKHL